MTAPSKRRGKLEAQLEALHDLDPAAAETPDALDAALARGHAQAVVIAAHFITKHRLDFADAMERALARMMEDSVKRDPGCHAKVALLEAMLEAGGMRYTPFRIAVAYTQWEPAFGGPVDTATGVRALGLLGLVATLHPDALLFAGELMTDTATPVRLAAIEAVARMGQSGGAALLLMRLRLGDEDPAVLDAAARALLVLAEERALEVLGDLLRERDETLREIAALALGGAKSPRAMATLLAHTRDVVLASDRALFLRAVGLSRADDARGYLLDLVANGSGTDARNAIGALGVHRYDDTLVAEVAARVAESAHDLSDAFDTAFGDDED